MSLIFAGIAPHSPLLLETVAKTDRIYFAKTLAALETLEKALYASHPHVLVVCGKNRTAFNAMTTITGHDALAADLSAFGDFSTSLSWPGATTIAAKITKKARTAHAPIRVVGDAILAPQSAIPLLLLARRMPHVRILSADADALLPLETIRLCGAVMHDVFQETNTRVALLIAGDTAGHLSKAAPGGFHKNAEVYDTMLRKFLERGKPNHVYTVPQDIIENAEPAIHTPLLLGLAALGHMPYRFEEYMYEFPFGIGALTGEFHLQ